MPIAGIEKILDGEGEERWELRRYASKFDSFFKHPLSSDVRLMLMAGDRLVDEFMAFGGEPLADPVVALQIEAVDESETVTRFRVLGASPVRTSRPKLGLAVDAEALSRL